DDGGGVALGDQALAAAALWGTAEAGPGPLRRHGGPRRRRGRHPPVTTPPGPNAPARPPPPPPGHAPPGGGAPCPRRRPARPRHRPPAPGRGAGPAGGRPLYLHQGPPDRPLQPAGAGRRNASLVPGELPAALPPAGVHGRADTGPSLAAR